MGGTYPTLRVGRRPCGVWAGGEGGLLGSSSEDCFELCQNPFSDVRSSVAKKGGHGPTIFVQICQPFCVVLFSACFGEGGRRGVSGGGLVLLHCPALMGATRPVARRFTLSFDAKAFVPARVSIPSYPLWALVKSLTEFPFLPSATSGKSVNITFSFDQASCALNASSSVLAMVKLSSTLVIVPRGVGVGVRCHP